MTSTRSVKMIRQALVMAATLALGVFVVGCDEEDDEQGDESAPRAESKGDDSEPEEETTAPEADGDLVERARELGGLAGAIESEPARADELLDEADLSAREFEDLLFEIAADPAASQAYADAR